MKVGKHCLKQKLPNSLRQVQTLSSCSLGFLVDSMVNTTHHQGYLNLESVTSKRKINWKCINNTDVEENERKESFKVVKVNIPMFTFCLNSSSTNKAEFTHVDAWQGSSWQVRTIVRFPRVTVFHNYCSLQSCFLLKVQVLDSWIWLQLICFTWSGW